ncbi:MAG: hypothetical protein MZV70_47175 [Desulfobacterales bacterium]|nr:hypothetical protein [Desulfobacterales bacterium]
MATDHAPHPSSRKSGGIIGSAFGIIGFETAVPVVIEMLRHRHGLSHRRILELMSTRPASIIGIPMPAIRINEPAEISVYDPECIVTIDSSRFLSKSRNTPFQGMSFRGCPKYAIHGAQVMQCDIGSFDSR